MSRQLSINCNVALVTCLKEKESTHMPHQLPVVCPILARAREWIIVVDDAHCQLPGEDERDDGHRAQPTRRERPWPA